jgi:hypothetical protein
MQQQISQNIIKVKYIKEEDRIKQLRQEEAAAIKYNTSTDSLEEVRDVRAEAKDGSLSPRE